MYVDPLFGPNVLTSSQKHTNFNVNKALTNVKSSLENIPIHFISQFTR